MRMADPILKELDQETATPKRLMNSGWILSEPSADENPSFRRYAKDYVQG